MCTVECILKSFPQIRQERNTSSIYTQEMALVPMLIKIFRIMQEFVQGTVGTEPMLKNVSKLEMISCF